MTSPQMSDRGHTPHCREHSQTARTDGKHGALSSRRLWRQMLIGFLCAASLGVIMLILGSVFIGNAIKTNTSITVMLCVLGMVCGLIILCGTACLGKMLLTRKHTQPGDEPQRPHRQPDACLHPCSIIYTPSQDQLNNMLSDPPPAYEMIILSQHQSHEQHVAGSIELNDGPGCVTHSVMMAPPKYSIAAAPLPAYGDPV